MRQPQMCADVSEISDLGDGLPLLVRRGRYLVDFRPSEDPPDIEIRTPAHLREFLTTRLGEMYEARGAWDFYYRDKDLVYHSRIPEDLPRIDRGFSINSESGQVLFKDKKATAAQVKQFWEPRNTGATITRVPDVDPVTSMEHISEEACYAALKACRWPGWPTSASSPPRPSRAPWPRAWPPWPARWPRSCGGAPRAS
jgi:hypothetical protein